MQFSDRVDQRHHMSHRRIGMATGLGRSGGSYESRCLHGGSGAMRRCRLLLFRWERCEQRGLGVMLVVGKVYR